MAVHDVLVDRRAQVIACWKDIIQRRVVPEGLPAPELVDHMPEFLEGLSRALSDAGASRARTEQIQRSAAAEHGRQRLRLGFSLDSVVYEYGALQNAIVSIAEESGEEVNARDLEMIFDHIISGLGHAVSEYVRQRDAEFLRQANEHFAFVAHELRNPLSSARTALHILEQRGILPADDDVVRVLERAIRGTSELVDENLQTARLASGIELRRRWIKLSHLVRETELEMQMEARAKDQAISIEIQGDPTLHVDPRLVHSALDNIVRNAIKYTPPGGSVRLRARAEAGYARIEVEDCCGGLPPGKVEEVFAPFVQLDPRKDGFGLGLAIARQAADAHGGTVRVQNLPGKGCVFALELPIDSTRG